VSVIAAKVHAARKDVFMSLLPLVVVEQVMGARRCLDLLKAER
jgi:hypothetical protein